MSSPGRQWIFLVDNKSGAFTTSRADARESVEIVSLLHPGAGCNTRFMFVGDRLLEVQKISPDAPASWLIDQSVNQDGDIYVATPCDPMFIVLPHLERCKKQFSPIDQILAGGDSDGSHLARLAKCPGLDLSFLCDVNDQFGADTLLYRLNEDKVVLWLRAKARRAAKQVRDDRLAMGAASATADGFNMPEVVRAPASSPGGTEAEDSVLPEDMMGAIDLVGEYVSSAWKAKLKASMKVATPEAAPACEAAASAARGGAGGGAAASGAAGGSPAVSAAAAWNAVATESSPDDVKKYTTKRPSDAAEGGVPKKAKSVQSLAQKRLAKTNTKGMASMMSFFGKKSK